MDAVKTVGQFKTFIEKEYMAELLENSRKGNKYLVMDFKKIARFDIELSELLLDETEDAIKSAEMSIETFDLPNDLKDFTVRIKNLPNSQKVKIRDIRSKHIGKFIKIIGYVRQKSDVRPQAKSSRFECPSCGNVISILQLDNKFKEPTNCGCGRKGKFRMLSKELADVQSMTLEEATEDLSGSAQPKRMKVLIKDDLTSPLEDQKSNPGTKVILNGIVKEIPITLRTGGQSTRYDLMIEGNYLETIEEEFGDIIITDEDKKEIEEISKDKDLIKNLVESIAPSIYGLEKIKEALLLQLAGGVKEVVDGDRTRGDMHILLIGDAGCGKSQLLKRISNVAPKARFVSGKGASSAGLTASVVKDDFLGGWALEAGALPLANKGILCLDELDKMSKEDTSAMHEAMEGQLITISKANIQATLKCETTILAAANPKHGNFDLYAKTLSEQIDLPTTLINRFDLIFPVKDVPDPVKDEKLGKFILTKNNRHKIKELEGQYPEPKYDTQTLRKYIAYSQKFEPELSMEIVNKLTGYYLSMRGAGVETGGIKSVPISARQLEGVKRLAQAYAKLRLSNTISDTDAQNAIELMDYCLKQVAFDKETGTYDIGRLQTGTGLKDRAGIVIVKEIINRMSGAFDDKCIPVQVIISTATLFEISENKVDDLIDRLKKSGDIFENRPGFLKKL